MNWASRRQIFYATIVVIFLIALATFIAYPHFTKAPTCTDGKQDGTETGIDCGGSCPTACTLQVDQISILWARAFEVVPGRYNAVAYLENHNPNEVVEKISYEFRFADKDNLYLGSRTGTTYVPPGQKFAVFEPAIDLGNSVPVYTTFQFTSVPVWLQVSPTLVSQVKVSVNQIVLTGASTSPKLSAVVQNNSLFQIPNINLMAILYDASGNAVNVSKTFVDTLNKSASVPITFTWPEPLAGTVVAEEIIPIYDIFSATLH